MKKKEKSLQPAEMPLYRYWQALYLSFYSRRLYVDVAKRWKGYGFLYLLLVIAVCAIPLSLKIMIEFNRYFYEQMIEPIQKLPPLFVQNGQVVFDKPMPYLVKNRTGNTVGIVDTTGVVSKFDATYPDLTILVTRDKIYFRPPKFQVIFGGTSQTVGDTVYTSSLTKESNEIFKGDDWVKSSGILKLKYLTEFLIYPIITLFIYALYSVFMMLLALLGQLFASTIIKHRMTYIDTSRLFFVTATPQIALSFALLLLNRTLPGVGYFYVGILAIYFYYAVICVKHESTTLVRQ